MSTKEKKEERKPTLNELFDVVFITKRYAKDKKSYAVTSVKRIIPRHVQCTVKRIESTGKGAKDYVVLTAMAEGGFANADDFDYEVATRAAVENAIDLLESGIVI